MLDVDVNDGVYVNDEWRKFENESGISFPVTRTEYWERALSQAQKDHERKPAIQQDAHGENQDTCEESRSRCHQSHTSPRRRSACVDRFHLARDFFSTLSSLCTHHIVAQGVARRVCIKTCSCT